VVTRRWPPPCPPESTARPGKWLRTASKRSASRTSWSGSASRFAAADAPGLKRRLARIQAALNDLEGSTDHERFARLNDEWHRIIIDGSGDAYVAQVVERLRIPVYRLLFSTFYKANRINDANAGHRRITEAIVRGKADHGGASHARPYRGSAARDFGPRGSARVRARNTTA
jgi:DNA-binding FadR family transcriptional regulator